MSQSTTTEMTKATEEEIRRRDLITGQLSYLLDEISALSTVLTTFPDDLLEAQPFEGEPSVKDLFSQLATRESAIRIPNVGRFIASDGDLPALIADAAAVVTKETKNASPADVLGEVVTARSHLLELVRSADESAWDEAARLAGEAVTMTEYLFAVVQEDVELLRAVAQRIYESKSVGSPGFTAR